MYAPLQFGLISRRALTAVLIMAAGGSVVAVLAADAPTDKSTAAMAIAATNGSATPAASGGTATNENSQLEADNDLRTLETILNLSPERLTALRKALEHVEKMSQAERNMLRQDIQNRRLGINQFNQENRADLQQFSIADRSVLQQYLLILFPDEIQSLLTRFHAAKTPDERKQIILEMLKTATAKGIKPILNDRGPQAGGPRGNQPPGGRNGRNGPGASGDNGRGDPKNDNAHSPMPGPAPIPAPAQ